MAYIFDLVKGKMKLRRVAVLVAWVCCFLAIFEAPCCMCSSLSTSSLTLQPIENNEIGDIYKIKFSTQRVTRESYTRFILELQRALTEHADRNGPVPVLPAGFLPNQVERYIYVELSNGVYTIMFCVDIMNAYLVGYQAGGIAYFFSDYANDNVAEVVFRNRDENRILPFNVQYGSLEGGVRRGDQDFHDRRQIPLGFEELSNHITNLYMTPATDRRSTATVARALIVVVQMVSEAARFRNILREILNTIRPDGTYGVFYPDGLILEYETSWDPLSESTQSAGQDGNLQPPVTLSYDGQQLVLSTLRDALIILFLLKPICRNNNNFRLTSSPLVYPQSSLILPIRFTFEDDGDGGYKICQHSPYTNVRITGLNGLCVDRDSGLYRLQDKYAILQKCQEEEDSKYQVWTFTLGDNTIKSSFGDCLGYEGDDPGHPVKAYNCEVGYDPIIRSEVIKWEVVNDGSIIHSYTGLALSAQTDSSEPSDEDVYYLMLRENSNASSQAWYASNNTKPPVKSIVASNGFCLLANDGSVWLEECQNNLDEKWEIYPDGTIRPQQNRKVCLKPIYRRELYRVMVRACDGSSNERWLLRSDGTIYHMEEQMVLEMLSDGGDSNIAQVSLSKYDGVQPHQVWFFGDALKDDESIHASK